MNVVSLLTFTILLNLLIIGCTPVNVSLNSEFGLSVGKSPGEEQTTKVPKISVSTQPLYINKSNSEVLFFEGTCENVSNILIKVNNSSTNKSIICNTGTWSISLDASTVLDGSVSFEFLDRTTSESLKTISLEKDTVPPVALLGTVIPAVNNNAMLLVSVDSTIGVSNYSYKYGLAASTDCSIAAGYSVYVGSNEGTLSSIADGDGNYKLCLIGKDAFENEQFYPSATVITWELDSVAPVLSFLSATSSQYINSSTQSSFTVAVNCSEHGRNVQFTAKDIDGLTITQNVVCTASGDATTTFALNTLAEGQVTFRAYQEDLAGNTKLQTVLSALKDTTAPIFATSVVSDGNYYSSVNQSPVVSWPTAIESSSSGSGLAGYKVGFGTSSVTPNLVSYFSVGTVTSLQHNFVTNLTPNTLYYTFVKAVDNAGNSATLISDGWKPDITAPTVGSVDDGVYSTPGSTPTVSWGAGTDGAGSGINNYELAIGTTAGGTEISSWASVGSVTSITQSNSALVFGGGNYYVSIRAVDNAGNIGSPSLGNGFIVKLTIVSLKSNNFAHAAIMANGKVVSWGDVSHGGDYSSVPTALKFGPLLTTAIAATSGAFAAITNDGAVHTWGEAVNGGSTAAVTSSVDGTIDVVDITSNTLAFAALRANGSVVSWGSSSYGGIMSGTTAAALDGTIPAVQIKSTSSAFAAIRSDGSVIAWGLPSGGGDATAVSALIDGSIPVVALYSTSSAFIARRNDGSLVTWGYYSAGVSPSSVAADINGAIPVTNVMTNTTSVAALRNDGSVITWGTTSAGGDSSSVSSSLNGTIDVQGVYSNPTSFSALRVDGSVITWGFSSNGGNSSGVAAELTGSPYKTINIAHTNVAYAAIRDNGSVIIWGQTGAGASLGSLPASAVDGSTSKVTHISGSYAAFAALRDDGSVVTWGSSSYGGDSSAVTTQLNGIKDVVALYSNQSSFVAVYADGQFVTWGDPAYGGDSSSINPN